MTNMSVDAGTAAALKSKLRSLGVRHPHVFGREFLILCIRASARLRALVPRVYGLGDLSLILDERHARQTKALLSRMLPTLQVYVPTTPHRQAVRSLRDHGLVLLLGDPATGKSTIAAILATTAAEDADHPCYKADGPENILDGWNPDNPGAFFWIDDAFGPNQPRQDFIDRWVTIMLKVPAAIAEGNRFVLTSRKHIYEAAKPKLGSRNHPLFRDGQAIVQVGGLSRDERQQILYNHIKAGKQPTWWKSRMKPLLDRLSQEHLLIPEIARRLADPAYTRHIVPAQPMLTALLRFIWEPKEHLVQTIGELSKLHRAALTLVFLHRGSMPVSGAAPEMQQLVLRHFAVDAESLGQALTELLDSFLVQAALSGQAVWSFKHPTITDALSAMLGDTNGMTELYLRGAKPDSVLTETVCEGAEHIRDAVVIPENLGPLLAERLGELPDELSINRNLFAFLDVRASEGFFRKFILDHPSIFTREISHSWHASQDPRIRVCAKAHKFGLLPPELRSKLELELHGALFGGRDLSFLDDDAILALFQPTRLLRLSLEIRTRILPQFPKVAGETVEEADLECEPSDNFDELRSELPNLKELFDGDEAAEELLTDAETSIDDAIEEVQRRKEDKEREEEREKENERRWESHAPARFATRPAGHDFSFPSQPRSIFSDVDAE